MAKKPKTKTDVGAQDAEPVEGLPPVVESLEPTPVMMDPPKVSLEPSPLFVLYAAILGSMDHQRDVRQPKTRYRHALDMAREALEFYNQNQQEA